ncbi:hypothetical protein D6774_03820 [Candidatus Woesearchaeota archaeon]|nr:MAG: hypothetical protein D6774_03820 [Candidatus Woesearchaeota archaeon]
MSQKRRQKQMNRSDLHSRDLLKEFRIAYGFLLFLVFFAPIILQIFALLFHHVLWYTVIFERLHILAFILFGLFFLMDEERLLPNYVRCKDRKKEALMFGFLSITFLVQYYVWRYGYATSQENWFYSFTGSSITYSFFIFFISIAMLGISFWQKTVKNEWKKLVALAGFVIVYRFIKVFFTKNWQYFSNMVNQIAVKFLSLFYDAAASSGHETPLLRVNDFSVIIARDCSGIESATLFLFLFAIVLFFDDSLRKDAKTFTLLAVGVAGAFILTAIRVIILSIIGVEFSADFAVTSFHANIGWVLFVFYVFAYYALLKKYCARGE